MFRTLATILATTLAVLAISPFVHAGKKIYVGSKTHKTLISMDEIDHASFDRLLKKHVDRDGMVNYRAIKQSQNDTALLDNYLAHLSSADLSKPAKRESQLAFWINAYNAVTMKGILDVYPTPSIREHTAILYGYNIWKDLLLHVGGRAFSLEDIEHKMLRKMNEPRIHFAIVCASKGCPRLLSEAYVPAKLEQQLEGNSIDFFLRKQNFRHERGRIYLSELLDWYGDDFGSTKAAQLKAYSRWITAPAAKQAVLSPSPHVSFLKYDWAINEQPANTAATQK